MGPLRDINLTELKDLDTLHIALFNACTEIAINFNQDPFLLFKEFYEEAEDEIRELMEEEYPVDGEP